MDGDDEKATVVLVEENDKVTVKAVEESQSEGPDITDLEIPTHLNILSNDVFNSRKRTVRIDRAIFTEGDLDKYYGTAEAKAKGSLISSMSKNMKKLCSTESMIAVLFSLFPVIAWLPKYNFKKDMIRDVSAGLTLGIIQIPQGMAYGMLTTLPAIYGLYASLIPVFVYFVFGTSKHLNIGTFAIICLMVGEVVESNVTPMLTTIPVTNGTSTSDVDYEKQVVDLRVQYAVTASFLVGVLQVLFGFLRFGFITIFLSDPLISGFTTGAAFHIFSSQVKHLVGMKIPRKEVGGVFGLFKLYIYIFKHATDINYGSLIIGVVAAIMLYVIKYIAQKYKEKLKVPIPAELIVVILGTGLSYGLHFNEKFDVPILKDVPTGMPPLSLPLFSKLMSASMIIDCLSIAIVSYAISISIAKAFAKKNKYAIDSNQELFAHGATNIVSSFFSCHVASGSLSRSLIQENLGSTQLSSLFACVLVVLTLTVLAPFFQPLPNSILAAIVLIALKGLFKQFAVLKTLFKLSKIDMFVWVSSFVAVFCLGVDYGLAVGLVINLLSTVARTSQPSTSLLAHVKETGIYTAVTSRNEASLGKVAGVSIFQFHSPLLYINVDHFQNALYKSTVNPSSCITIPIPKCHQIPEKFLPEDDDEEQFYIDTTQCRLPPSKTRTRTGSLDSPLKLAKANTVDGETSSCPLHTIILDCSQISYADTMGVGVLISTCSEYKNLNVDVYLCNTPLQLLHSLDLGGFIEKHGKENVFMSVHDAVQHTLAKQHSTGICQPTAHARISAVNTPDKDAV